MDFSDCKLSGINYGGSEKKLGIIFNNEKYMLNLIDITKIKQNKELNKLNTMEYIKEERKNM